MYEKNMVPNLQGQKGGQIDPKWDLWVYFVIGWLHDQV